MKKRIRYEFLIPVGIVALLGALTLTGSMMTMENRLFDFLLALRKSPVEDPAIVLVDFDDPAISAAGTWPIGRDVMADGLLLLGEMGARYSVFDIEYVDKSPRGVNGEVLSSAIPEVVTNEVSRLQENVQSLFAAIAKGSIRVRDAGDFVNQLLDEADAAREAMLDEVAKVAQDNDRYLADAARLFGNAFFTVTLLEEVDQRIAEELRTATVERHALKRVTVRGRVPAETKDIRPAIPPLIEQAKGVGFPNVVIDADGVRRKIDLLARYKEAYFPQLVLAPLLDYLGDPEIVLEKDAVVLKDAQVPGKDGRTVRIPLTEDGKVIINWPHKSFLDSFRHVSFYELIAHKELYDTLVYNLKIRDSWGYLDAYKGDTPLLDLQRQAEAIRNEDLASYRSARDLFLSETGKYLASSPDKEILATVQRALEDPRTPAGTKGQYREIQGDVPEFFAATASVYGRLMEFRGRLEALKDGFCIIGNTGTGTTDIGVNPFEKRYMNVGTHASVANMILQEDFLDDSSPFWSLAVAAVFAVGLSFLVLKKLNPLTSILIGLAVSLAIVVGLAGFFIATGKYVAIVTPAASVFLSFITLTFLNFLRTEKEKGFIRNAFSHYLSADVIKEIIADPQRLNLGGQKRLMSVLFTDIRGFSTVSEKLSAEDLVRLLNQYLTAMSDIILDMGGTIDKYEGDAIMSFFGAPNDLKNHAENACLSAIRMNRMEKDLNERFLKENLSPSVLFTRIGINTGEMVVGNMGTTKKMNYTVMGDSVNLASRLEGVNKVYGTSICISEETRTGAGEGIVTRMLDRVRVVGKQVPIRIYEVVGEKGSLDAKTVDLLDQFHQGMELYEKQEWTTAAARFRRVLAILPEDGPGRVFLKRCQEYKVKLPVPNWDGVFNLTAK